MTTTDSPFSEETIEAAREQIDRVRKEYEPRILEFLADLGDAFSRHGMDAGGIDYVPSTEHRWDMAVRREGDREDAVVTVTIAERLTYGEGNPFGITFHLNVVEIGGRILAQYSPYNYTPQVWVDARDGEAVEQRFTDLVMVDQSELAQLVKKRNRRDYNENTTGNRGKAD